MFISYWSKSVMHNKGMSKFNWWWPCWILPYLDPFKNDNVVILPNRASRVFGIIGIKPPRYVSFWCLHWKNPLYSKQYSKPYHNIQRTLNVSKFYLLLLCICMWQCIFIYSHNIFFGISWHTLPVDMWYTVFCKGFKNHWCCIQFSDCKLMSLNQLQASGALWTSSQMNVTS